MAKETDFVLTGWMRKSKSGKAITLNIKRDMTQLTGFTDKNGDEYVSMIVSTSVMQKLLSGAYPVVALKSPQDITVADTASVEEEE